MQELFKIRSLVKNYKLDEVTVPALLGVDLDISKGEMLAIIGPSGSGKTTLLNCIGLIDTPTSGEIFLDGENVAQLPDRRLTDIRLHKVGFIFQTFNLIPVLTALENVEFPLLLQEKHSKEEVRQKAKTLLEKVGIGEYLLHRPAELSGGQRQRVAIARALVTEPAIILADEPTANLDSVTGRSILELMKQMKETSGTTFIFSTHDPKVLGYAERVVRLKDGLIDTEEAK